MRRRGEKETLEAEKTKDNTWQGKERETHETKRREGNS
jgi:hypothetical protein